MTKAMSKLLNRPAEIYHAVLYEQYEGVIRDEIFSSKIDAVMWVREQERMMVRVTEESPGVWKAYGRTDLQWYEITRREIK